MEDNATVIYQIHKVIAYKVMPIFHLHAGFGVQRSVSFHIIADRA